MMLVQVGVCARGDGRKCYHSLSLSLSLSLCSIHLGADIKVALCLVWWWLHGNSYCSLFVSESEEMLTFIFLFHYNVGFIVQLKNFSPEKMQLKNSYQNFNVTNVCTNNNINLFTTSSYNIANPLYYVLYRYTKCCDGERCQELCFHGYVGGA